MLAKHTCCRMFQRPTAAFITETSGYKCVWLASSRIPTRRVFLATQAFIITIFIFGWTYPGRYAHTYMVGALQALAREAEATTTQLNTCIVRASCYCKKVTALMLPQLCNNAEYFVAASRASEGSLPAHPRPSPGT